MTQCVVCECSENSCKPCKSDACFKRNCYACCCEESHSQWRKSRVHRGLQLEYIGISWMVVETVGAITAAILASSFALLAFGVDSIIELSSAVVVLRHLSSDSSGSSAQGEKTALLTALLLVSIVPVIGISSTYAYFFTYIRPEASPLGFLVALVSVLVMSFLWREKKRIGQETACLPLTIDATESQTCFLMSIALLCGLATEFVLKLGWIDYAATLVIVGFVAYEAKGSIKEARAKSFT